MLNVKGRLINILGKNVVISQEPTYPVVKFVTHEECAKHMNDMSSKFYITESLTTLDGGKIIVNYIKKAKS